MTSPYNINMYTPGSTGWSTMKNEEFQEDDIWRIHTQIKQPNPSNSRRNNVNPTPPINIPKSQNKNHESKSNKHHQSAPVDIPNWSKIYGTSYNPRKKSSFLDDQESAANNSNWDSDDEEDEDEDEEKMVPPHELIARRLARAQISSFSVCEGIGRTLKGRDQSNVRNAVLTRTGFLE